MRSILKKTGIAIVGVIAASLLLLICIPADINAVAWQAPVSVNYTGPHARNERLSKLVNIDLHGEIGPEHIAIGPDEKVYAATVSGYIIRMNPDGSQFEKWVKTKGRILGFAFNAAGDLIAADAMHGLIKIDANGKVDSLLEQVDQQAIQFANSIVVAKNGKIYFTDSSTRFTPRDTQSTFKSSIFDIFEHSATGRVIEFDPTSKQARIIAEGLSFANGIALSENEKHLFVAETGEYRIWKIDIQQSKLNLRQPQPLSAAELILTNLPGFPDNLMRGSDGKIWVGLTKPRSKLIDGLADKPWIRTQILKLPQKIWPVPPAYGHIIAFNEAGKIVADMQDPSGKYPETSGATEFKELLFIQSLHADTIATLKK